MAQLPNDVINEIFHEGYITGFDEGMKIVKETMQDTGYKAGEWNMFKRITNAYYDKEIYFLQDDGTVYSRNSHKDMGRDDAFGEFIERIREEG